MRACDAEQITEAAKEPQVRRVRHLRQPARNEQAGLRCAGLGLRGLLAVAAVRVVLPRVDGHVVLRLLLLPRVGGLHVVGGRRRWSTVERLLLRV